MSTTKITNSSITIIDVASVVLRPQVDYLKARRARQDAMSQQPLLITPLVADVITYSNQLHSNSANSIDHANTKVVKTAQIEGTNTMQQ